MGNKNNIQNEMKEENIVQNRSQALQNEVIAPFKEISYDEFEYIQNEIKIKNKKCCSFCCAYKIYQSMNDYADHKIDLEKTLNDKRKLCCFNAIAANIICLIFDFLLIIPSLYFCFYMKPDFKKLKEEKNGLRLLDSYHTSDEYGDYWFDIEGLDLEFANIQPKYKLWYKLSISEIIFFFFNIIFDILFLIFLIFQIKYSKIITEKEKKNGKITKRVILINFIFFILYLVMIFFSMYFYIFNMFVIVSKTFKDNTLCIFKFIPLSFKEIFLFIQYYELKILICFYMDLNNLEEIINNDTRDNINEFNKIKTGYLFINYKNIEVDVIANKNLYLVENKQTQNDHENKIYEFKKIRSNKTAPEFEAYIKIKNDAIQNMLSITDWRYLIKPESEKIYRKLDKLLMLIGLLIILFTPPLYFHAKDEEFYNILRKNIKNNIFKIYGDFEYAFSIIRYLMYIIIVAALLLLMFKRIFYGGYVIYKLLRYSNIICYSLISFNLIIVILNILLIIFSVICNSILLDFIKKNNIEKNYTKVFYLQNYYSYFCLVDIIVIIYKINSFRKMLVILKNDIDNLNITENGENENEFQFKGLDGKNYILKEFKVNPHPGYLYYKLYNFDNDININNNVNNNINNNIINEELFKKEAEINNEHLDSKNNINLEDTKINNE